MMNLPTAEALAEATNETMQALYGFDAAMVGTCGVAPIHSNSAHTMVVPLIGAPLYLITTHAESQAGMAFASALFNCELDDTSRDMSEDSLRELCTVVAGQVKSMIAPQHEIGLPSRLTDIETLKDLRQSCGVRLRFGQPQAQVDIAINEFPGFGD